MGYHIAALVFWVLDIRGHIPQFGNYHPVRNDPAPDGSAASRIVIGIFVCVGLFALALWFAVWLAIRLL